MLTVGVVSIKIVSLVGYGVCLGVGFWMAKKITNKMDEWLVSTDMGLMQQLRSEA